MVSDPETDTFFPGLREVESVGLRLRSVSELVQHPRAHIVHICRQVLASLPITEV